MSQVVTKEVGGKVYEITGQEEVGRWLESSLDIDEYVIREEPKGNKNVKVTESSQQ